MNCPVDATPLVMTERQDVEIDYCPQCRGVWLDRGELDKIIERAATMSPQAGPTRPPEYSAQPPGYPWQGGYGDDRHGEYGGGRHGGGQHGGGLHGGDQHGGGKHGSGRRRRGWLGELFD